MMANHDNRAFPAARASRPRASLSARRRSAARRGFASRVNHALRGDVHAVRVALSAALEQARAVSLPGSVYEALTRVDRAVAHLERRTLDIALLTQAESGSLELSRQPERLRWVIEETWGEYREMARRYGVRMRLDLAACGAVAPRLDRELMRRALGALLDNAIRFSPPGGSVMIHGERDGDCARITVRDQGKGFAPGDAERVFAPFVMGQNAESGSGNGLGLGLAVARVIIEAHRGRVWVEHSDEPGGVIAVELPIT